MFCQLLGLVPPKILTYTAEPLLAEADQHVETEVAVRGPAEMLQPPRVLTVFFHVCVQPEQDEKRDSCHAKKKINGNNLKNIKIEQITSRASRIVRESYCSPITRMAEVGTWVGFSY